ncbi:site-specific DNA-methyltransferase [Candidatus Dependentiae bacterium]|nr:site-specific DNA-methyltransferase [Candidatus Dependentiae bacterium]
MANNSPKKGRYTQYPNKIGLFNTSKGNFIKNDNDVVLSFPFKDAVLEAGMSKEDVGRDERFLHQTLDSKDIDTLEEPKVLTDFRLIDKDGEKGLTANSDIEFFDEKGNLKQNLLIKGNNLLVLYTLRERLAGKVKLIYIDPPYNTKGANDIFTYNNSFSHSAWLTFMKNRLEVAHEMLRNDGFIAITIDHVELFYLGALADEVFGAENRIGVVTILINPKGRQHEKFFSASTEYMLVYAKDISKAEFEQVTIDDEIAQTFDQQDEQGKFRWESFARIRTSTSREAKPAFYYPIFVSRDLQHITTDNIDGYTPVYPVSNGKDYSWKTKSDTFIKRLASGQYRAFKNENGELEIQHKYAEQQVLKNLWTDKKYFPEFQGTNLLKKIVGEGKFSYPKSLYAVMDTVKLMSSGDDIVLDFFAGSSTTGHAVLELNAIDEENRRFILAEQIEKHYDVSLERITKVTKSLDSNAQTVCFELKKYNQEYIDAITEAASIKELENLYVDMRNNAFLKFWFDRAEFEKDEDFRKLDLDGRKQALVDILDENQLYLNYADMNDTRHEVSVDEKELTNRFYGENEN